MGGEFLGAKQQNKMTTKEKIRSVLMHTVVLIPYASLTIIAGYVLNLCSIYFNIGTKVGIMYILSGMIIGILIPIAIVTLKPELGKKYRMPKFFIVELRKLVYLQIPAIIMWGVIVLFVNATAFAIYMVLNVLLLSSAWAGMELLCSINEDEENEII
jgi:hypothetical protein